MTAEQLLDLIAQREYLSPRTLESLRRQLQDSQAAGRRVRPERLLDKLVDRGKIDAEQAAEMRAILLSGRKDVPAETEGFVVVDDEEDETKATTVAPEAPPAPRGERRRRLSEASSRDAWGVAPPDAVHGPSEFGWTEPEPSGGGLFNELETAEVAAKPASKRSKRFRNWNSPLVLLGGGGVLLLILLSVALVWALGRETADQAWAAADESYREGAYSQAIERFAAFGENYPNHPQASAARVAHGMAQIWNAAGTGDPLLALQTARDAIPRVSSEAAFPSRHDELADALTQIASGVADRAAAIMAPEPGDAEAAQRQLTEGKAARDAAAEGLALLQRYVPANLQPTTVVAQVESTLVQLERRLARAEALESALEQVAAAAAEGRLAAAFDARRRFVVEFPESAGSPRLQEAFRRIAGELRSAVVVNTAPTPAAGESQLVDPPVLALPYHPRGDAGAAATGRTAFVAAADAVWAVDAGDGSLAWRLDAGGAMTPRPIVAGERVLAVDSRVNQLLGLSAGDGEVAWRRDAGGAVRVLESAGDQVVQFEGSQSVRLVNFVDGASPWTAQFPQALAPLAAYDETTGIVAVAGDAGVVYLLDIDDGACQAVVALGHLDGTLVSLVALNGRLVAAEAAGEGSTMLHVVDLSDLEGAIPPAPTQVQFEAELLGQLQVAGRRVFALGRDQSVAVYEPTSGGGIRPSAVRGGVANSEFQVGLVAGDDCYFGGDSGLFRLELQATRQAIDSRWRSLDGRDVVDLPYADEEVVIALVRDAAADTLRLVALSASDGRERWSGVVSGPAGAAGTTKDQAVTFFFASEGHASARRWGDDSIRHDASFDGQLLGPVSNDGPLGQLSEPLILPLREPSRWAVVDEISKFLSNRGEVRFAPAPALREPSSFPPIEFQGGLLVGDAAGRIALVDVATAQPIAVPFQPPASPGQTWNWSRPAVRWGGWFAVAARPRTMFLVQYDESAQALKLAAEIPLSPDLFGEITAFGDRFVAALADGSVAAVDESGATEVIATLPGRPAWGPAVVRSRNGPDVLLLATTEGRLHGYVDGEASWSSDLPHGLPIGADWIGSMVALTHSSGWLTQWNHATGEMLHEHRFGVAWAGSAVGGFQAGLIAPTIHGDWRWLTPEHLENVSPRRPSQVSALR